jgi:protoporphyrin/coproporphyrin ferrochelatase
VPVGTDIVEGALMPGPSRRAVLLVNLGSPDAPTTAAVRRYLDEFLMDRHVIDVPWLLRRLIVSFTVLPFRPKRSAAAYRSIWGPDGSPLISNSRAFAEGLATKTGLPVAAAMRYGSPSIATALDGLLAAQPDEILLLPMYPQHADSSRTTTIERVRSQLRARAPSVRLDVFPPFFDRPDYIDVLARHCRAELPVSFDQLILSYHGLPERQLVRADPTKQHCLARPDCCETASVAHATCYRHQTRVTSRMLTAALGLGSAQWTICYQSRLGRMPWLPPFTDEVLRDAPGRGWKRIAVVCPAFVADNLETLEEMGQRGREIFKAAGGEDFNLISCLNASPEWVETVGHWCVETR